jgi:hypothetical protein
MKTMTIIAERRNTDTPDIDGNLWRGFLAVAEKALPQTKDTKRILENVWQLPVELGLKALPNILPRTPAAGVRLAVHISDEPLDFSLLP